jgi:hypothetical protein
MRLSDVELKRTIGLVGGSCEWRSSGPEQRFRYNASSQHLVTNVDNPNAKTRFLRFVPGLRDGVSDSKFDRLYVAVKGLMTSKFSSLPTRQQAARLLQQMSSEAMTEAVLDVSITKAKELQPDYIPKDGNPKKAA